MLPQSRIALLAVVLLLSACSTVQNFSLRPYRMNVQQGNFLEARDIDQIQVGMTQSQVRFLIGTPMVSDPFNSDRWDYVFFFKVGATRNEVVTHVTIWFEGDRVVRIDRPMELEDTLPDEVGFDA